MVRIYIYIYYLFLLLPHFYPLLLSPLSRSSYSLFFPLQASIPPLAANPSPCPVPRTPIDLFVLRPYLSAISFFLYSVSQSFSISNTKTYDCRCWVLIWSPWLTKERCCRDWVLCWWVLFLFWWMGFDFVDGWWMGFVDGGWVYLVLW